jgi:hypothetical protein
MLLALVKNGQSTKIGTRQDQPHNFVQAFNDSKTTNLDKTDRET